MPGRIEKKNTVKVRKLNVKTIDRVKLKKSVSPKSAKLMNVDNSVPNLILNPKQVAESISVLLQLVKKQKDEVKKKALFKDEPEEIILQVIPIKIPVTHMEQLRIVLPHPMLLDTSDVCLITKDVKKATKDDHEPTIAHYKGLLKEKKIKGVTQIVPIRQLRSEYVPYEMKGRFADLYDVFLVDGRLFGKVTKILGSRFFKKNKDLIPVKVNTDKLKEEITKALAKTVLTIHGNGDSFSVKVGYSHFSEEQLSENISAVATVLKDEFPGGVDNLRKLLIKTSRSIAIPIYLSLKPSNSVPVPVVSEKLPKEYKAVEGELTTFISGRVTVLPTGEVYLRKVVTKEDVEMGHGLRVTADHGRETEGEVTDLDDDQDVGDNEEQEAVKEEPKILKRKKRKTFDDEDSSDEDVEAAEDAYLKELQNELKQQAREQKQGPLQKEPKIIKGKKRKINEDEDNLDEDVKAEENAYKNDLQSEPTQQARNETTGEHFADVKPGKKQKKKDKAKNKGTTSVDSIEQKSKKKSSLLLASTSVNSGTNKKKNKKEQLALLVTMLNGGTNKFDIPEVEAKKEVPKQAFNRSFSPETPTALAKSGTTDQSKEFLEPSTNQPGKPKKQPKRSKEIVVPDKEVVAENLKKQSKRRKAKLLAPEIGLKTDLSQKEDKKNSKGSKAKLFELETGLETELLQEENKKQPKKVKAKLLLPGIGQETDSSQKELKKRSKKAKLLASEIGLESELFKKYHETKSKRQKGKLWVPEIELRTELMPEVSKKHTKRPKAKLSASETELGAEPVQEVSKKHSKKPKAKLSAPETELGTEPVQEVSKKHSKRPKTKLSAPEMELGTEPVQEVSKKHSKRQKGQTVESEIEQETELVHLQPKKIKLSKAVVLPDETYVAENTLDRHLTNGGKHAHIKPDKKQKTKIKAKNKDQMSMVHTESQGLVSIKKKLKQDNEPAVLKADEQAVVKVSAKQRFQRYFSPASVKVGRP